MYPPIASDNLNTSTYIPVRLPANNGCSAYSLWTEDGSAYYYSTSSAGTDGILVTSDGSACLPAAIEQVLKSDPDGVIIGYIKGTAVTRLVGLITKQ